MVQAAKANPSTKEARQLISLAASFIETSQAFNKLKWPAEVPAVVIVSATTPFDDAAAAQWWRDAHATFAAAGSNCRLVTAEKSSHDIPHDRPDVIADAVVQLASARH